MNFQIFAPSPALAAVVRCFWTLEVPAAPLAQTFRFLPDGCPELLLHLHDPATYLLHDGSQYSGERAWLLGPMKGYIDWQMTGDTLCVLVKFQPWALATLLGRPAQTLADAMLPLGELPSLTPFRPRLDALQGLTAAQCRFQLEEWLLEHFEGWSPDPDLVKSVEAIEAQALHPAKQRELALPIGRRRLEQKFQREIGLSPKFYARNMRMHAAALVLRDGGGSRLTSLALEMGYYDQAHFIREFKQFTGLSPRAFLRGQEEAVRLGA